MIYLFIYQSNLGLFRSSDPLIREIKAFPGWAQCLDGTWLIATHDDLVTVNQILRQHLNDDDLSLLVPIEIEYQGWLPNEIWDWITNSRDSGF